MRHTFKFSIVITILFFSSIFSSYSQNYGDTLNLKLTNFHKQEALPGFAAAIVDLNGMLYQKTIGYADIESKRPYTNKTMQCIASTTKTTIAYAVMKLQEEGELSLESPINDFLPFKVIHPFYKDSVIKIKHLVTHTSGIKDTENNYDLRCYYFTENTDLKESQLPKEDLDWFVMMKKNRKISLESYFHNIFSEKGKWNQSDTFHKEPFAEHYTYTNVGAGLMAYIIERITGHPFDKYITKNVFQKLGMKESTFDEYKVNPELLVTSYVSESKVATPSLGFINYPDGGIHTNIEELSLYLIEMIKGYNGESDLLTQESFKQMMSPFLSEEVAATNAKQKTFNNIGVFWQMDDNGSIKHYGGNPLGGTVYFSFNPKTNIGKILMTNSEAQASRSSIVEFISIWRTMEKYEALLPNNI
ncbi:MAG: serine hydrolase domain-containing protein [Maribacter sp.]